MVDKSRGFMKEESLEKSASIRKLLAEGLKHWKEQRALIALEEGKMSFLKASHFKIHNAVADVLALAHELNGVA